MRRRLTILASLTAASALALVPAAHADSKSGSTPVATCGTVLTAPGTYGLVTDLACGAAPGVTIVGSNIVFFMNGHTIQSTSGALLVGFGAPEAVHQDKVEGPGVLTGGATHNPNQDFLMVNASDSLVEKITATDARVGFYVWNYASSTLSNDRFVQNVADGLDSNGFQIQGYGVQATNNDCSNNGRSGIELSSDIGASFDNFIVNNTCDNNSYGVLVDSGSTPNEFHANTAYGNSAFDLYDGNPICGANIWEGDHFLTTNQPQCVS